MASRNEEILPDRYIRGCDGDMEEAQRRWNATLAWRREERVDGILREPQPFFEHIKSHYQHGVHRMAKNGNYVYIERPPKADLGFSLFSFFPFLSLFFF